VSEAFGKWARAAAGNASFGFAAVLLVFILAWEAIVRALDVRPFLVPAPSKVFIDIIAAPGWFAEQAYYTLLATAVGFGLAVAIGILFAIAIAHSRLMERVLLALLVALNSVPKVAVAPLLIIWVGTGIWAKIWMAMVIALFAIVVDMVLGLRSVDPDLIDLARSLGGKPRKILYKIRFPNALPSLFAGMKVAVSLALVGAIVGEFVASGRGLGFVIITAQSTFDTTRIFAAILILSALGVLLFAMIDALERLLIPWHVSRRAVAQ
jgi:NitT/TauT family transport system permease protein